MDATMKTVAVTGASSGFGEGAAKAFSDRGYRVWGTMRDAKGRNAQKKAALEGHSDLITIIDMDVSNDTSVADGFARILADGPVDILINNAGIMFLGITEAFSVAQAHEQMNTNYYGAIRAIQQVLPSMRQAGAGLIINTSSAVGRISPPFFGTYSATKHALEAYSQALRYEVSPFGVDVAMVEPGPFGTGLLGAGKPPALTKILESYGELSGVPAAMGAQFAEMLTSEGAPDPNWVVQAYLSLADMPAGTRPARKTVGLTWGVDEINSRTQSIQDDILNVMHLETVLGGTSA